MLEWLIQTPTPYPWLNGVGWGVVLLAAAYLARPYAHSVIRLVCFGFRRFFRVLGRYLAHAEYHVRAWTRAVLIAQARQRAGDSVEWSLERLQREVQAELEPVPHLQQQLRGELSALEEDYRNSVVRPPEPPEWEHVVHTVGEAANGTNPALQRTLEDLRDGIDLQRADLLEAYRRATRRRYLLLHRMMPAWRRVARLVERVDARLERVRERVDQVREMVGAYQELRDDQQVRIGALAGSALGRFLASAVLLAGALAGFAMLWQGVRLTFELLGSAQPGIAGFAHTDAVALLVVVVIGLLGLILLESVRITRLLPAVGWLGEPVRRWIFWLAFTLLTIITVSVAMLTWQLGLQSELFVVPVPGVAPALQVGVDALVVLFLPYLLAFSGAPLAGAARNGRVALGLVAGTVLQLAMLVLRLAASFAAYAATLLVQLYDLGIFLPLWLEKVVADASRSRGQRAAPGRVPLPAPVADRSADQVSELSGQR